MNESLPMDLMLQSKRSGVSDPGAFVADLRSLDRALLTEMLNAGHEVLECRRVLKKGGLNIVGEVLRGQGEFYEMSHYPKDDVYDAETFSQYYYHAHRGSVEHGHFHTFLRSGGMPNDIQPLSWPSADELWPQGDNALSHLVAISMDGWGDPIGLFMNNRWVTDETWYSAEDVIRMLPGFAIDHANPSWPTNRWLTAMLVLYRPWIEGLIRHRDKVVEQWQKKYHDQDVFEDRRLEITGYLPISVQATLSDIQRALDS